MRKLIALLGGLAFFVAIMVLAGPIAMSAAQPSLEVNNMGTNDKESHGLSRMTPLGLNLTHEITKTDEITDNNTTHTLYLPLVLRTIPLFNPKKGLDIIAPPACSDMVTLKASWYLNWGVAPEPTCGGLDLRFVPRIPNAETMPALPIAIQNAQASGWLIGFSEPNLAWQGDMSPVQGAELWRQIEEAADAAGIKLVSPSPNQFEPGQEDAYGHQWLWAMVDEYRARYGKNPRFDAIGWNIYGCTNNPNCRDIEGMKQYLVDRYFEAQDRGYHVPIWVLEYGGCLTQNSEASDQAIMTAMTTWFNETWWIERYAWYSNRNSSNYQGVHNCILIDSNSNLTTLGQIYQPF